MRRCRFIEFIYFIEPHDLQEKEFRLYLREIDIGYIILV